MQKLMGKSLMVVATVTENMVAMAENMVMIAEIENMMAMVELMMENMKGIMMGSMEEIMVVIQEKEVLRRKIKYLCL